MIRPATIDDAPAIAAIYNHYVSGTIITFETETVSEVGMGKRIADVLEGGNHWLVAEQDGALLGYAYSAPWKARAAYRHSVEISVYLKPEAAGRGWGLRLYTQLFALLRAGGVHAVIGGIALPNPASIALHEKCGMRKVAQFHEVGRKFGRWIDVGYWQLTLRED